MQPNTLLDALLDEAGISHAGLAAHVNQAGRARGLSLRYEHTAVARWLKGQRPRGQVPDLICEVLAGRLHRAITLGDIGLGVNGDSVMPPGSPLSGFVERATALWRCDEQQRRHIIEAPAVTGTPAVMPVWEWENPPEDADVSRSGQTRVSMADITMLRAARAHYELMYRRAGGIATRARIVGFLNAETAPLLRGGYSDALGRQLHRATGGLVAVAGICAYDSDAHGLAQRYFHQALRLAKASGDRGLGAYVIALLVNQSLFMAEHRQAVAFAEAALRSAGDRITPPWPPICTRCRPRRTRTSETEAVLFAAYGAPSWRPGAFIRDTSPTRPAMCSPDWSTSRWPRPCSASATSRRPVSTPRPPSTRPRTTAAGCTGSPCSVRSSSARARSTARPVRRWRWRSGLGAWSRSGCGTGCARCGSISS